MKTLRRAVWASLFLISSLPLSLSASESTPWETTLQSIEAKFEEIYCFKDLKREFFNWDPTAEMNSVRENLSRLPNPSDAQAARNALLPFYQSTRDIHVGARFKTSSPYSSSRLPLVVRSADHRHYIIVNIDRKAMPIENYPFQIGDELLSIDGKRVSEWVSEYLPSAFAQKNTQHALAERYALYRYDVLGLPHHTGEATIVVRGKSDRSTETYKTAWIVQNKTADYEERMNEEFMKMRKGKFFIALDDSEGNATIDEEADLPIRNYGTVGAKKPFFGPIGKVLWQTDASHPFYAYISELPNHKKAGFIRVPSYAPNDMTTVMIPAFYGIIDRFVDENVSVMIYDQTNNGGGSLLYTYDLLAGLIGQKVPAPLKTEWIVSETHHEVSLKWADLKSMAEKALTDPAERAKFQSDVFSDKIIDDDFIHGFIGLADRMLETLKSTNPPRLSPAYPFEGQEFIKPRDGKRFTGPIVMLANELSISDADLTPALFQDLKRATIFGSKTSGAGAYQNGYVTPENNPFELWYSSMSFGKFTRKNGAPIENLAVTPDVRYTVTKKDLQNGMQGYRNALTKLVLKIARNPQINP